MANTITLFRCLLLGLLLAIVYLGNAPAQLANAPLVLLTIGLDGVDGWVARKRGETSVFGATFDIAADRIFETVLWVVLAQLQLIGVWVPLLFIVRGHLVDAIRSQGAAQGVAAFDMPVSPLARCIVAGRFMRALYAVVKAVTFAWILFWEPFPQLTPHFWATASAVIGDISLALVCLSAALCIIRGFPVIVEFLANRAHGLHS